MNTTKIQAKDLSMEPPRSPRQLIAGYAILARCLDKGRAELNNTPGEYHFGCPLDKMLLDFKGVSADDIKKLLRNGATDEAVADWLSTNGKQVTRAEIDAWTRKVINTWPSDEPDPEKREWFAGECKRLGLDPEKTSLFDYLEEDDRRMALQTA
ncbi:MAG TPA: DUF5069 domain-containing protein [Verrucomicrobiales bacterium]|nr:DUF5069 domain-containing protein [Verrucomicrobiales bacterium]